MTLRDDLNEIASRDSSVDEAYVTLKDTLWFLASSGETKVTYQFDDLQELLRCGDDTIQELMNWLDAEDLRTEIDYPWVHIDWS